MALVEHLIAQIPDAALRKAIEREVADLKKRLNWGLVFERHIPESTRLLDAPIKVGSVVWDRQSAKPKRFRVRAIEGSDLVVVPEKLNSTAPDDAETLRFARTQVLVEKPFEEPVFPTLTSLGSVRNGQADRPSHAVIEGENYHAIELLLAAYEGKADLLYLDPPYNTGDKDWAYNNDYVDPNDQWRPSKWLAFMERRLRLGRRLLKPDGVMVVTIDEHEVLHLGMLLEQVFPEARIQMVTIVTNPSGVDQGGLSRVEEYAFFCFFGSAGKPLGLGDDMLADEKKVRGRDSVIRWEQLLRAGVNSARSDRPKLFYPLLVQRDTDRLVRVGDPLLEGDPDPEAMIDGYRAVWPVRENGTWGNWRNSPATMQQLIDKGFTRLGRYNAQRKTWVVYYVSANLRRKVDTGEIEISGRGEDGVVLLAYSSIPKVAVKTVWHRIRHNAPMSGSQLLLAFMGRQGSFPFPKSLYAVRDTLDILLRDKSDALLIDFFAGSGTTLHATMLLNSQDGGRRRCVLVTNNEVNYKAAAKLHKDGHFRGDPEFEAAGVFESATRPRTIAALTGVRPDGVPVKGAYLDGREYSAGFEENVEFFRLSYLDPIAVELGLHFRELHPLLWLAAGGVGERAELDQGPRVALPPGSPYAVLFDPAGMPELLAGIAARPQIAHVFIVADSDASFADLASSLPHGVEPVQLYRAYLEILRGATE